MFSLSKGTEVCVYGGGHPCYLWRDTQSKILSIYLFYKRDEQPDLGNLSHVIFSLLPVTSNLTFLFQISEVTWQLPITQVIIQVYPSTCEIEIGISKNYISTPSLSCLHENDSSYSHAAMIYLKDMEKLASSGWKHSHFIGFTLHAINIQEHQTTMFSLPGLAQES